ncbi:MAG: phosphonate metabolism protein/1,5-bisphosphokinase (PRPP-forming) PhnN [Proteobacteria bacterium]|nr:phosphonate metabolism protein/1,5-bisphosphokinase (PRPP-forming) PhnN [Pseudomonadota bacterium]
MRPGVFFLIVGPSGVGKDTLIDGARARLAADARYVFAQRVITRPADAGGEQHLAATEAAFEAREQAGGFLLTWSAHGLRYGLPAELSDALRAGRHVVANGSRATIRRLATRVERLVMLSISADRGHVEARLGERGRESEAEIAARLARAVEVPEVPGVETLHVANNGSVEQGVERLIAALEGVARRLRVVPYPIDTWREHIAYLPADSVIGAHDYLGPDRIDIVGEGRSIRANVHVAGTQPALAADQIGLSRQAFEDLGLPEGASVGIHRTPAPESRALLRAKLGGTELDEAQYRVLLTDIMQGRYPPGEVAAFLVAASHHLSDDEVAALARVRAGFMRRVAWPEPIVVDKHSMGGIPGSRITLIVIPIVAAHGLAIPKTSSRAITSAAGTADAMEVLAKVDLTAEQLRGVVERTRGCVAWNGRLNHTVLDDVMNTITGPLGIDSGRWSVASILSKKLSAGSTHVIVDLPYGPQAKLKSRDEGLELARLFETVGRQVGLTIEAHATDGAAPIGRGIGPALEARDVLRVLDNATDAPPDLRDKALFFASRILAWDPAIGNAEQGLARAWELLRNGAARRKLDEIVDAQGRRQPPVLPGALTHTVRAQRAAPGAELHIARITEIARRAGAPNDKSAGIDLVYRAGTPVHAGQELYVIHSSSATDLESAATLAQSDPGLHLLA